MLTFRRGVMAIPLNTGTVGQARTSPRICKLCAEMILEVVDNHIRPKDNVHHGQIVWTAVSVDDHPGGCQKIEDTDLVTVVLDASTAEDVQARIDPVHPHQWKLHKAIRMCHQAYEQGGLLTNQDLSEILNVADSLGAQLLSKYERQNKTLIPRRGTIHAVALRKSLRFCFFIMIFSFQYKFCIWEYSALIKSRQLSLSITGKPF